MISPNAEATSSRSAATSACKAASPAPKPDESDELPGTLGVVTGSTAAVCTGGWAAAGSSPSNRRL